MFEDRGFLDTDDYLRIFIWIRILIFKIVILHSLINISWNYYCYRIANSGKYNLKIHKTSQIYIYF